MFWFSLKWSHEKKWAKRNRDSCSFHFHFHFHFPYYCERSELLFWQLHQFELGCIKLHTPYRYKVHPKLYSDWSMCTVFCKHRVEFLNTLQHRVESLWYSVVLSTSWLTGHVMLELKSVKVIHLLMTARQTLRQLHCLSAPGI